MRHSKQLAGQIRSRHSIGDADRHVVVVDESGKEIHRQPIYPGVI
ncbi:hypothetical protein [Bradyrhizobium sp. UASWS1016]